MDPRDRLWTELIFPRCEPDTLLVLRAVCRPFLAQLNAAPARLWRPLTMELWRMRYDERLLGWGGVVRAMEREHVVRSFDSSLSLVEREHVTRANCDAGRFTRGPFIDASDAYTVSLVAGRVVVFRAQEAAIYDDTGCSARLQVGPVGFFDVHELAVMDRLLLVHGADGRLVLVDCVVAQIVALAAHAVGENGLVNFSVAGACVAFWSGDKNVTVKRVLVAGDAVSVVDVAHVELPGSHFSFQLCERGRSYFLFVRDAQTFRLVDLATGQAKRHIALRTTHLSERLCMMGHQLTLARASTAAARFRCYSLTFLTECPFAVVRLNERPNGRPDEFAVLRLSDGHLSKRFSRYAIVLDHKGRACGCRTLVDGSFTTVDAVTGSARMPIEKRYSVVLDTSGALVWRTLTPAVVASSGPAGRGRVLRDVSTSANVVVFRYGACLVSVDDKFQLLRFN